MTRAFIVVLDSFGIGESLDAHDFGDGGADTFGHIDNACQKGLANRDGVRNGALNIPNLERLGLRHSATLSHHKENVPDFQPQGAYGYAKEVSCGKDTPSGHWEIAGLPVTFPWDYFPKTTPCFPQEITKTLITAGQIPGILGNCHASGTEIIKKLGIEHMKTGQPICYTSADSVFQIAANEESFGLDRLYELCAVTREILDDKGYNIGRVIARPFIGNTPDNFKRTSNRRDITTPPHKPTLLDVAKAHGHDVISIGKIADIFAHKGITKKIKAPTNTSLFEETIKTAKDAANGSLIFTNLVDFDMLYGHRRDVVGYAHALESFDKQLPNLESVLKPDDIVILTADHGCDPTFKGTDHTREYVPILIFGPKIASQNIGERATFADMGQTVAAHLGLPPLDYGTAISL